MLLKSSSSKVDKKFLGKIKKSYKPTHLFEFLIHMSKLFINENTITSFQKIKKTKVLKKSKRQIFGKSRDSIPIFYKFSLSTEKIRNSRLKRISTKIYKKAEKVLVFSSVELRNSLYTTVISKFSPIFRPEFRSEIKDIQFLTKRRLLYSHNLYSLRLSVFKLFIYFN